MISTVGSSAQAAVSSTVHATGMRRAALVVVLGVVLAVLTSGCGVFSKGAYDVTLPGGADVGSSPYEISAKFGDVLDLVPQSSVKVDDVAVGRVSAITLSPVGRSADVTMLLNGSVSLAQGTSARIEQTSLLGEKYVSLIRPTQVATGAATLAAGSVLDLAETSQAVDVEQVLGALSLLLNGGGIGQFQEIAQELTKISAGRPEEVRNFLEQIDSFVTQLDSRSDSITTALDGLDTLGKSLDGDRDKIAVALDDLSPGLSVLSDQREELVRMLTALDRLSSVTVQTLNRSSDDIVRDFRLLAPTLKQLGKSGSDLPKSLEILLTYPFPDSVLNAIRGDYINSFLTLTLRTTQSAQPGIIGPSAVPPRGLPINQRVASSMADLLGGPSSSQSVDPSVGPTNPGEGQ